MQVDKSRVVGAAFLLGLALVAFLIEMVGFGVLTSALFGASHFGGSYSIFLSSGKMGMARTSLVLFWFGFIVVVIAFALLLSAKGKASIYKVEMGGGKLPSISKE
jgi:hypothetical protein